MILDFGWVAVLAALDEHVAHLNVRGTEQMLGGKGGRGGGVQPGGKGVGLLGIGEGGDERAMGFVLDGLVVEEPRGAFQGGRPCGVEGEQLAVGGVGGDGLAAAGFQIGGGEQGLEFRAGLRLLGLLALSHAVEDAAFLLGDVGEGHVHAFLFEDAGHFPEDGGGVSAAFDLGEALGEFIEPRDAGSVCVEGGFAEFLALGGLGSVGFGEVAVALPLGAEEDLFADAGGGDLRPLDDRLLAVGDFLLPGDDLAGAFVGLLFHPPLCTEDDAGEEDDGGCEAEDGALPAAEVFAEFFELVVHALDLEVEGEVALRSVVEVLADFGALAVVTLKLAALGLVGGGVGAGVAGEVELRGSGVALAGAVGDEEPSLLAEGASEEELVLGVGAAAKLRIRQRRTGGGVGRLCAVALTDDLDEARAVLDFPVEHVTEVAVFGAEDVLALRLKPFPAEDVGDALAGRAQLASDGGDENTREVTHGRRLWLGKGQW